MKQLFCYYLYSVILCFVVCNKIAKGLCHYQLHWIIQYRSHGSHWYNVLQTWDNIFCIWKRIKHMDIDILWKNAKKHQQIHSSFDAILFTFQFSRERERENFLNLLKETNVKRNKYFWIIIEKSMKKRYIFNLFWAVSVRFASFN